MGRAVLKDLKASTLLTFFEICSKWGLKKDIDFNYNSTDGIIKWSNGSEIYLKDMELKPSDPEFDSLGSREYTGSLLDEVSEIGVKAYKILTSRIRFKLSDFCSHCGGFTKESKVLEMDEKGKPIKWLCKFCNKETIGLIPKIFLASNPCKHWAYTEFYRPFKKGGLPKFRKFLPALVGDNPYISKHYVENLKKLDKNSKERLLYGNWEYDDDPARLFEYESILDMFTNTGKRGDKYCVVDVAGKGRDKTVIGLWEGLFLYKVIIKNNISDEELDEILIKEGIPRSKCLADEDGVGFGLVKDLQGIKGFVNNSKAIKVKGKTKEKKEQTTNYKNLKAQCWYELADYVDRGEIGIYREIQPEVKQLIIEDLEQIKQKNLGKDQPLQILTKEDLKEVLGRSTDCGDMLMMRMWFVIKGSGGIFLFGE